MFFSLAATLKYKHFFWYPNCNKITLWSRIVLESVTYKCSEKKLQTFNSFIWEHQLLQRHGMNYQRRLLHLLQPLTPPGGKNMKLGDRSIAATKDVLSLTVVTLYWENASFISAASWYTFLYVFPWVTQVSTYSTSVWTREMFQSM